MKLNKSKALLSIFFCFFLISANAQRTTVASGGNASGSGGSVSYTIGQMDYTTNTGSTGSAMQGVQQPYEIIPISSTEQNISAFPNPTDGLITLSFENYPLINTTYQIYDEHGRLLQSNKINLEQTTIDLTEFATAIYFLKIQDGAKELKVFKIFKTLNP
jgi:hypothetical protein